MRGNRRGFTLIELLIVVVIIGVLAAVALPKFGSARERAQFTAMKTDLANMRIELEVQYYQNDHAYPTVADGQALIADGSIGQSPGVTLTYEGPAGPGDQSWTASATHTALGGRGCAIAVGEDGATVTAGGEPVTGVENNGVPICDE